MYNVQFQILKRDIMNYRIRMIPDWHIYRLNIVFSFEKCAGAVQFQSKCFNIYTFSSKRPFVFGLTAGMVPSLETNISCDLLDF